MVGLVASLALLTLSGSAECKFSVSGSVSKPEILGPEEITSRVRVVEQPDSPLAIVAIDFTDSILSFNDTTGSFEQQTYEWDRSEYRITVRNRSDRRVDRASILVEVSENLSHPAHGASLESLGPGEKIERVVRRGYSRGGGRGILRVFLAVSEVEFSDCTYWPSATWSTSGGRCSVSEGKSRSKPELIGPEELFSRVRVLEQPDSPVVIESLELDGTTESSPEDPYYSEHLESKIVVRNVGNRTVESVGVIVAPYHEDLHHLGGHFEGLGRRSLAPESSARLSLSGGYESGTHDAPPIVVAIDHVKIEACRYWLAMSWPKRPEH